MPYPKGLTFDGYIQCPKCGKKIKLKIIMHQAQIAIGVENIKRPFIVDGKFKRPEPKA